VIHAVANIVLPPTYLLSNINPKGLKINEGSKSTCKRLTKCHTSSKLASATEGVDLGIVGDLNMAPRILVGARNFLV
jgi:hypothetical protein